MILISYGYVLIAIIIGLFFITMALFAILKPINSYMVAYNIHKKLKSFLGDNKTIKLFRYTRKPYNYELVLRSKRYYISLLSNPHNYDVHFMDEKFYFMDKNLKVKREIHLGDFTSFEPEIDKNRETRKLIIVYPNTNFIYNHLGADNIVYVYMGDTIGGIDIVSATDFLNLEELD